MSLEIEHKYLVINNSYLQLCTREATRHILQGYLNRSPVSTVRIRLIEFPASPLSAPRAFITIKGITLDDTRAEYEYEIPAADAPELLKMCRGNIIDKTRYIVPFGGHTWEVDIFHGHNQGLQVAEIELERSTHDYPLPPFAGEEVTGNPAYYNSAL